ncbi:tryptophan synthase subunit alpha [Alginatibacterium sediminis]|uniref:Tryptophan synthase alpha chain n=1 Tax=Alginatibacterium sediminis TaxID=2164068 RepID=A0A420EI95_9ALTE|nr:tryptophan synthase subunit alpha [Alginatibacterium sediminis]RKF20405.1 tryptophan synthase subunit alpha [Alginatibacterium sediminis]
MAQRYETLFASLKAKNQGAFVPFVTLGDPNPGQSLAVIDSLIEGGADALELGFPFSDPVADGPTIQGANIRALDSNVSPDTCIEMLTSIRAKYPDIPIGLLLYANLVFSNGIDAFYQRLAAAGVDSVLVADVPLSESLPFREAAKRNNIDCIFIAPPNADEDCLAQVAQYTQGYTYLLSRAGVTGTETKAGKPISQLLDNLNRHQAAPALLGFGISSPEQVAQAISAGAAGAISGSAVVKIIESNLELPEQMLSELKAFTQAMKAATQL